MKITAKIHRIMPGDRKLKAIAEVMLDDEFVIQNVRLVRGRNGLFAAMPDYIDRNGEYRDHCFPITVRCGADLNDAVITAYREACESLL